MAYPEYYMSQLCTFSPGSGALTTAAFGLALK